MRVIVVLCFIAVAAAQYDYQANQPESGSAQLSEPIQPVNEFNKEFFSYSAPDHEFDDASANDQIAGLKKSLRVLFIRGPDNAGLENAALQLAKSAADDRTAVYVLSKQADIGDLASQLAALKNNANNKPEVHFVKYRTQSDADNAQRTIQSQFDSLPGPSSSHNAGSAPVLDFASKGASVPSSSYVPPQSSYLPPGRRF